ncbi:NRDE-2, necessary for RNA interference-domain-containing protein [Pseudoneurospora amorphoporcata]|uniref:NRDE-2, necessary for RNA interference-domain-containing protein n=1 Tax=Pseudoneurospora amorphoporcata TaxID=241081 RepID=A0AAN6NRF0_9PEZI|nr:NRDE-2, necessary for RNA interference-domain-containing protein [Pseudoneurospora amorphoporcata]
MSSDEVKRRAVPKFTSFAPATPAPEAGSEKRHLADRGSSKGREKEGRERRHRPRDHDRDRHRDSDREKEREREGKRERVKDRDRHHDSHHSRHYDRDRHHRRRSTSPASQSKEKPPSRHEPSHTTQSNDVFYFDNKEDPLIFRYGGNERSKIPAYRRYGAGKIIGSPGYLSVYFQGSKEVFAIGGPGEGRGNGSVFRDKTLMNCARAEGAKAKHIKPGVGENGSLAAEDVNGDFISLEPPRKRQRADISPGPGDGRKKPDYRSIYGKAKSDDEESDTDDTSSDSESEGKVGSHLSEMSAAKKRSLELHRQIKARPGDTKAWLELIGLQDALLREHQLEGQSVIGHQVEALAELKLSLYYEALPHAADTSLKEALLTGMMREGEKVWDPKQLAKRWEETSKTNPDSFFLWVSRLNYELSQVATFTNDELKSVMVTKLQSLSQALAIASSSDENNASALCTQLIYVFVRLTCYLRDSGYVELAVAVWQATLELNFCRPSDAPGFQSVMEEFSDFWESEVPRIGEENAKGWRHFVEDMGDMADPPESMTRKPSGIPETKDPFEAWASLERQQAVEARMPARTLDEGTDDDPFRVIMFSDIKDLVLWFAPRLLSQAQPQLVEALLTFCRLPTYSALRDPFIAPRGQAFEFALNQLGRREASTSVEIERKPPLFGQQGGNMALSQELLFSGQDWFQYLGQWSTLSQETDGEVDPGWVLETLRYLVLTCSIEQLAEYYLALAWLKEPSGAKKVAKGLLKRYSSKMRLYSAYAMIEYANGSVGMAEKVLLSATSQNAADGQILWNTWVWMHLKTGKNRLALLRLLSSVDSTISLDVKSSSPVSPALLLKARAHFSTKRDYSLSSHQLEPALQYAESFALLEYLSPNSTENSRSTKFPSQGNFTSALANIQSFATQLHSLGHKTLHERVLQTAARLLYHHVTHGPYKPSTLRQHLHNFIRLFPHNTLFLSLLAWAEQSTLRINDPVRSILRESLSLSSSSTIKDTTDSSPEDSHAEVIVPIPIPTHRFVIEYELLSGAGLRQPGTATIHSTKAAFEAAVSDPLACKYNVDIWIGYIRFLAQVYLDAISLSSPGSSSSSNTGTRESGKKKTDAQTASALKALKDVFYRAIAACPWSKRLYMEAFSATGLVNELSSGELRAVVGTMVAKGLRVHVDFEGFGRKWKEKEEVRARE